MFFKHFANKNQLPGLSVSGTLVENRWPVSKKVKYFAKNRDKVHMFEVPIFLAICRLTYFDLPLRVSTKRKQLFTGKNANKMRF